MIILACLNVSLSSFSQLILGKPTSYQNSDANFLNNDGKKKFGRKKQMKMS